MATYVTKSGNQYPVIEINGSEAIYPHIGRFQNRPYKILGFFYDEDNIEVYRIDETIYFSKIRGDKDLPISYDDLPDHLYKKPAIGRRIVARLLNPDGTLASGIEDVIFATSPIKKIL